MSLQKYLEPKSPIEMWLQIRMVSHSDLAMLSRSKSELETEPWHGRQRVETVFANVPELDRIPRLIVGLTPHVNGAVEGAVCYEC